MAEAVEPVGGVPIAGYASLAGGYYWAARGSKKPQALEPEVATALQ